jgi:hypothetical protein
MTVAGLAPQRRAADLTTAFAACQPRFARGRRHAAFLLLYYRAAVGTGGDTLAQEAVSRGETRRGGRTRVPANLRDGAPDDGH